MTNTNKLLLLFFAITLLNSCKKDKKGCTDETACNFDSEANISDNTCCDYCNSPQSITLKFSHNYDATPVTSNNFNSLQYTNQFGNTHSITKLRYLISDITLHKANGDSVNINGYNLVDVTNNTGLTYSPSTKFENGSYTGISFTWGFNTQNNITGSYQDLNAASWSWPMMLGGGYHFMQFEGKFINSNTDTIGFAYHNGTAREITSTPDTIFHPNHFRVKLIGANAFNISSDINTTIELRMDISKWFKSPNIWDLNQNHMMLMPNYNAQIQMNQNGRDVFDYITIQLAN